MPEAGEESVELMDSDSLGESVEVSGRVSRSLPRPLSPRNAASAYSSDRRLTERRMCSAVPTKTNMSKPSPHWPADKKVPKNGQNVSAGGGSGAVSGMP